MQFVYAAALTTFFVVMFLVALWAKERVKDAEDFIVAGRGLSSWVLMATLVATWFGAGSLSVSADMVRNEGLRVTALEPFGVGVCLILAGWIYARPMWEEKVLTLADVIRRRFGATAEFFQVIYNISYFGWIAVQLLAIGNIVHMAFGLDVSTSLILVTGLLTAYTLLGGMWSVALTDAVQVLLLILGLVVLSFNVLTALGSGSLLTGLDQLFLIEDKAYTTWIPTERLSEFNYWLGLFLVGSLGNIASQDLMQRIFAARTPDIAVRACVNSGMIYIVIALLPVMLGMAARVMLPEVSEGVIPALAEKFLSPALSVIFILTLTAAITSTVDSALLGPASTFAQNLLRRRVPERISTLSLTRYCVVFVAVSSAALALSGTSAIDLLQSSFALGIPPLVILTFGIYQKQTYPAPAIVTSVLGLLVWGYDLVSLLAGWKSETEASLIPMPLLMLIGSVAVYWITHSLVSWGHRSQRTARA
ncbi:sodium:solute symporter [Pseudomaricurvus alkylphenolicus]|uniref:sodium:solute symporter family transporter n=1 Tax=Pseudomaricurvus alkylphenolicus TaxID=1306991 RepID=UPI00141F7076|nr:sodium:solute symporter [Pseudomaricurvus alkylphenolicus]NIB39872.1 sodium:solute symporter [Pseudomaricurvus alkylphenolicus]